MWLLKFLIESWHPWEKINLMKRTMRSFSNRKRTESLKNWRYSLKNFESLFGFVINIKMYTQLLAYGLPKETVAAIMILYKNTKVKERSPDGDTEYFDIVAGVLQGDTLAPYLFIICLDYNITTLDGASLRLVDKFTYLGSSDSSTENDIDTRLTKAWTAIDRLSIIWKSDLSDKMKHSFFQAAVVSILLYGCTTWTLTKQLEKKLYGNYTRMLRAILNKSWRQHPTRHQLYGHLPPIMKTIQVRRTRHAGHCWRSKDELVSDVLLWTPTYG